jgi:NAD(P)-dependent dehydrogenase (short-subunit alcohol dehydrogenase family)
LLRRSDQADVIGLTSSVGSEPRAFWGGYGASKAALDTMLGAYADETSYAGRLRVHIVDPGATATRMRQLAFPGEEASTLKGPEVVASAIVDRLNSDAPTGGRMRVEG